MGSDITQFRKYRSRLSSSTQWHWEYLRDLFIAFGMLLVIFVVGTCGFMYFEGWSAADGLYMTVITLSTVGYGEVNPLSPEGRYFAIVLILSGLTVVTYCFSTIGRSFIQGELQFLGRIYRMQKQIEAMQNHTVICGYGKLARFVIPDLIERDQEVVVIERNPERINEIMSQGVAFVEGNAYEDQILKLAGVERASTLLSLLPDDAHNVFVTLSARGISKNIKIVARTEDPTVEEKLHQAGANQIIAPYRVSSSRLIQQLLHPYANDFLEIAMAGSGEQLMLEQVVIPEGSAFAGKTIQDSGLRDETGVLIAALIERNGKFDLQPRADTVIDPGVTLITIGTTDSLEKLNDRLASN